MPVTKRTQISKSLRFRIFRRDGFQCQYCGRLPPDVVLRVDHMVPVAQGGTNEEDNLITACHECNAGKGTASLAAGSVPLDADARFLETQQRLAELRRYREAKAGLDEEIRAITDDLRQYWTSRISENWVPAQDDFRYLLDDHDPPDIEKAIWIASKRVDGPPSDCWSYTLAILRNWRRDAESQKSQAEPS